MPTERGRTLFRNSGGRRQSETMNLEGRGAITAAWVRQQGRETGPLLLGRRVAQGMCNTRGAVVAAAPSPRQPIGSIEHC